MALKPGPPRITDGLSPSGASPGTVGLAKTVNVSLRMRCTYSRILTVPSTASSGCDFVGTGRACHMACSLAMGPTVSFVFSADQTVARYLGLTFASVAIA